MSQNETIAPASASNTKKQSDKHATGLTWRQTASYLSNLKEVQTTTWRLTDVNHQKVMGITDGAAPRVFSCMTAMLGILLSRYAQQDQFYLHLADLEGKKSTDIVPVLFAPGASLSLRQYLNETQESLAKSYLSGDEAKSTATSSNTYITSVQLHPGSAPDATYDLAFTIDLSAEQNISLAVQYNPQCFQDTFLRRAERQLNRLMEALEDMSGLIGEMEILPAEELSMLEAFNHTSVDYATSCTVVDMIREAAQQRPDAIAVSFEGESITYRELDQKTDAVAAYLIEKTALAKGQVVSVISNRSTDFIVAILGIIKSGGAYLPIDPTYPKERIEYMLTKSESKALMADSALLFDFDSFQGELFAMDLQLDMLEEKQVEVPLQADDRAYVIFTSGSTGKPKGVMVSHGALLNLVNWHCRTFSVNENSRATAIASTAFDASVWEVWPYLAAGAQMFPVNDTVKMNPKELAGFLDKHQITHTFIPTPMLMEFGNQGWEINPATYVLTGGDELKSTASELPRVVNNYGPSESTVVTTSVTIDEVSPDAEIPIGKPIDNIKVFIMDHHRRQLPVGVMGEIFIAGAGLAEGYINDPELTDEKFVTFADGTRGYATGDLGVWREDGQVLFKGRNDSQVKIRGNRIELEEVRKKLLTDSRIRDVIVLKRSASKGGDQLVCFYTSDQELADNAQVGILEGKLPDYMIPSVGMQVAEFPINHNGKIDRKKLLSLIEEAAADGHKEELSEDLQKMTSVWNEALDLKDIKSDDNFFSVGGDSIKAIRLVYAVNEGFDCDLKLMDIFKNDTPAKLLQFLDVQVAGNDGVDLTEAVEATVKAKASAYLAQRNDRAEIADVYPVADIQLGMLYHGLYSEVDATYHDQILHQVKYRNFDPVRMKKVLELMTAQHQILRTAFDLTDLENPLQIVMKKAAVEYIHHDFSSLSQEEKEASVNQMLIDDRKRPFDVSEPGLWRLLTADVGNDMVVVLLVCHHAIIDGWSDATFSTELNNLYQQLATEPDFVPTPLQSKYRDYVINELIAKQNQTTLNFWKNEFQDFQRNSLIFELNDEGAEGKVYNREFESGLKEELVNFASAHQMSPKVVCLAVYLYVINRFSVSNDLAIGLHTHNRPLHPDSQKVLGCFLNSIPFRITVEEAQNWSEYVTGVNRKFTELTAFNNLSLMEISKLHSADKSADFENPFFDSLFAYLDFHVYQNLEKEDSFSETFGKQEVDANGQGVNNTFLNFIVNTTLDDFNLLIFYRSTQIDDELITHIADLFENSLKNLINNPSALIDDSKDNTGNPTSGAVDEGEIEFNF